MPTSLLLPYSPLPALSAVVQPLAVRPAYSTSDWPRFHSSSCRGLNTITAEPVSRVLVSGGCRAPPNQLGFPLIKTGLVAYAARES